MHLPGGFPAFGNKDNRVSLADDGAAVRNEDTFAPPDGSNDDILGPGNFRNHAPGNASVWLHPRFFYG